MKTIEEKIIAEYKPHQTTLREVARIVGTDHHKVKRVLIANGIKVVKGKRGEFTEEHKRNISRACKGRVTWSKGKNMPKESLYKNMASHLRFDVGSEWLSQFEDVEKLKFLNNSLSRKRDSEGFDTEKYKSFVLKFYTDEKFNILYEKWLVTGDKWIRPSLDHINPKANGGNNDLNNLQFLSWFENRAKSDMSQNEWDKVKANIGWYFDENN